jgi:hypothetical protein
MHIITILTPLLVAGLAATSLAQAPPPGIMPYTAILDPQFVAANEASFLEDEDIVADVARGNVARADKLPLPY